MGDGVHITLTAFSFIDCESDGPYIGSEENGTVMLTASGTVTATGLILAVKKLGLMLTVSVTVTNNY